MCSCSLGLVVPIPTFNPFIVNPFVSEVVGVTPLAKWKPPSALDRNQLPLPCKYTLELSALLKNSKPDMLSDDLPINLAAPPPEFD